MHPGICLRSSPTGRLAVLASVLAFASGAMAYGFYDSLAGGTPLTAMGALSAATCGQKSTYSWDALAVFLNPAGLSAMHGPTATVSGGVMTWKEVLSYSYLRRLRSASIPGSRCIAGAIPVNDWLTAGTGLGAVSEADYAGEHLIEDPSMSGGGDFLELLDAKGSQYEALAGFGVAAGAGLSFGASAGARFGRVDLDYTLYDVQMEEVDSTSTTSLETNELAVHGGAILSGEVGALGISYCTAGERYPASLAAGAEIIAPHIGGTTVGFELEVCSPLGRNDINGKFNLRYPIAAGTQMMAGISFGDYSSSLGKGMGFSVGGCSTQGPVRLDAGVHWWSRSREGSAFEDEIADEISDSTTELAVGVTLLP